MSVRTASPAISFLTSTTAPSRPTSSAPRCSTTSEVHDDKRYTTFTAAAPRLSSAMTVRPRHDAHLRDMSSYVDFRTKAERQRRLPRRARGTGNIERFLPGVGSQSMSETAFTVPLLKMVKQAKTFADTQSRESTLRLVKGMFMHCTKHDASESLVRPLVYSTPPPWLQRSFNVRIGSS